MRLFYLAKSILPLACGSLLTVAASAATAPPAPLNLAIVRFIRPSPHEPIIEPTINALKARFGDNGVHVTELTMAELERAIEAKKIDVFMASAGFYRFNVINGARDLATLASRDYPNPNAGDGTALVVRADSEFEHLPDLYGHPAVAANDTGFTTLRLKGEIARRGFDPDKFFSRITFTGSDYGDESIRLLKARLADAALFRLCGLEERLRAHPEEAGLWRVVDAIGNGVCQSSTPLYPSWIIATTPATDPAISKLVTEVVLEMPETATGQYWTVATDLSSIDRLYKELKVGPYAYLREWSAARIWETYQTCIVLFIASIIGLIGHSARVTVAVRRRTAELQESLIREKRLKAEQLRAADRIRVLERTGLIGRISSMIAHELRQPLAALDLYGKSLEKLFTRDAANPQSRGVLQQMIKQTERISAIVDNVREYARASTTKRTVADLRNIVSRAAASWRATNSPAAANVTLSINAPLPVMAEICELEWELVVVNLLKNAAEALKDTTNARISVTLFAKDDGGARLAIADNGPGLSQAKLSQLGDPIASNKAAGLGLGLSVVRGIVENHASSIHFANHPLGGFIAQIDLPPAVIRCAKDTASPKDRP